MDLSIVAALIPVFVLILLGYGMRRFRFVPDEFWPPAEKLTYYVTFPALLVINVAEAKVDGLPWAQLTGLLAAATLCSGAAALTLRRWLPRVDGPAFTSILQGSIRPNTYIALAAAASLWGARGVTLTAVGVAVVVPLVNLVSVLAMLRFAAAKRPNPLQIVLPIVTNPLILACLLGAAINASGIVLPPGAAPTLKILGSAALPVGLLAVGAGLQVRALGATPVPVAVASLLKLGLLPLLTGIGAWLLGFDATVGGAAVLYAAVPCSASAYVLARQMNGDAPLMAAIITTQTLLAIATVPFAILLTLG